MQNFSYHTHTTYSDGKDTAENMIKKAAAMGWSEIGISDHLIVHKNFSKSPSYKFINARTDIKMYHDSFAGLDEYFLQYKKTVKQIAADYPLKVYVGAEVDFFDYPEWLEDFEKFRKRTGLDYYISGNHYLVTEDNYIIEPDDINNQITGEAEQKELISKHFKCIKMAVESGLFAFLAHIDYMRRVKLCHEYAFTDEKISILKSLSAQKMPMEVSSKGIRKDGRCYPDSLILSEAAKLNIQLIISDDAHSVDELGYCYEDVESLLQSYNVKNRWIMQI